MERTTSGGWRGEIEAVCPKRSSAVGLYVLRTNYNFGSVVPNRRLHLMEMMTRF